MFNPTVSLESNVLVTEHFQVLGNAVFSENVLGNVIEATTMFKGNGHALTDLNLSNTVGILNIARGGTGVVNIPSSKLLVGNGTGPITAPSELEWNATTKDLLVSGNVNVYGRGSFQQTVDVMGNVVPVQPDVSSLGNATSAFRDAYVTNVFASTVSGNGYALNTLNAANVTSGLLPAARLLAVSGAGLTTLNAANVTTGALAIAQGGTGTTTGLTVLDASNLTSGTVPDARLTGNYSGLGTVTATAFSGSGAALTTLNAANVTSGLLPAARLLAVSGAGLTTLNAANVTSGTLAVAHGGTGVVNLPSSKLLVGNGTGPITAPSELEWNATIKSLLVSGNVNVYGRGSFQQTVDVAGNVVPVQPDVSSLGNATSAFRDAYVTNVFAGNVNATGNMSAVYFLGNGHFLEGVALGSGLPNGGNVHEIIVKTSDVDGDVAWTTVPKVLANTTVVLSNLIVSHNAYVDGTLYVDTIASLDQGDATRPLFIGGNGFDIQPTFRDLLVGNVLPVESNVYSLGNATSIWKEVHANAVVMEMVRLGTFAGATSQAVNTVAVGMYAGTGNQKDGAVAIGYAAGATSQGVNSVAIGFNAGSTGSGAVSVGTYAGLTNQGNTAIAVGEMAGNFSQGANAISLGTSAGFNGQGASSVAMGVQAAVTSQGSNSVALGTFAGSNTQGSLSVAIGLLTGATSQGINSVAIGRETARTGQGNSCVAIGLLAGSNMQGSNSVAMGSFAGQTSQGNSCVAIGLLAGSNTQGSNSVALGTFAGQTSQGINSVAIGRETARTSQGNSCVAIGSLAGSNTQGSNSVALGTFAGQTSQGINSVAIGRDAAMDTQGSNSVAIGYGAGQSNQGNSCVAIGQFAGCNTQGRLSVAMGYAAGFTSQGSNSVAIGNGAGQSNQGVSSVAIGSLAGSNTQGFNSVAIGNGAGQSNQGSNAIAIGSSAGFNTQGVGSIQLNATGTAFTASASRFYVKPIGQSGTTANMIYNATSGEISYPTCSRRYKKNILGLGSDTSVVLDTRPVEFDTKDQDPRQPYVRHVGFIAEELADLDPRMSEFDIEGLPSGINWSAIHVYAIAELQKLRDSMVFAQYYECDSEISIGRTVVFLSEEEGGEKIREAVSEDDDLSMIIGVVIPKRFSQTSLVAGAAETEWHGKYMLDAYGSMIMEPHELIEWDESVLVEEAMEPQYKSIHHSYASLEDVPVNVIVPEDAVFSTHVSWTEEITHQETSEVSYRFGEVPVNVIIPSDALYSTHVSWTEVTDEELTPAQDPVMFEGEVVQPGVPATYKTIFHEYAQDAVPDTLVVPDNAIIQKTVSWSVTEAKVVDVRTHTYKLEEIPADVVVPETATQVTSVSWTETTDEIEFQGQDAVIQIRHQKYESHNIPPDLVIPDSAIRRSTNPESGLPYVHRKLNPEYDPDTPYVARSRRPEWLQVALLGRVRIHKHTPKHPNWKFLRTISEEVEEWFIR